MFRVYCVFLERDQGRGGLVDHRGRLAAAARRQVGFDTANRSGAGGNVAEVGLLASDIACLGFSWDAVSHAICVEETPGSRAIEHFNRKLCEGSALAPVLPDSIRFGSLACGHTNMGLRAIAAGCPSECSILSEDGRFSLQKLQARDPEYAKAVTQGLHWKVLRWVVRREFPQALDIIQAWPPSPPTGSADARSRTTQGIVFRMIVSG